LKREEILHVAIGQKGSFSGTGSGGTFVIRECSNGSFDPIVIAGGAGGDFRKNAKECCNDTVFIGGSTLPYTIFDPKYFFQTTNFISF